MRSRLAVIALVLSSALWSVPALAQARHVVAPSLLHQAIADQLTQDQQNRDALIGALRRPDVRRLADQLGLNVTRAEGAVAVLNSAELARMAAPLTAPGSELAGGADVVIISLTTLLLVVIIVILLVK